MSFTDEVERQMAVYRQSGCYNEAQLATLEADLVYALEHRRQLAMDVTGLSLGKLARLPCGPQ